MTQCTNGTRAKAGAATYFWFTWAAFIAWLAIKFARLGTIVWAFFGDSPFVVADFCASEPVIPSAPSTAEWLGFFTFDFTARVAVENYLIAAFKAYVWPTYCECVPASGSGATCSLITIPWGSLTSAGTSAGNRTDGLTFHTLGTGRVCYGAHVWVPTGATLARCFLWDSTTTTILRQKNITSPTAGELDIFFDTPYSLSSGEDATIAIEFDGTVNYYHWGSNAAPPTDAEVSYSAYKETSDYSVCPTGARTFKGPLYPLVCNGGPPGGAPITFVAPDPTDPVAIPDHPEVTCSTTADLCTRVSNLQSAILMTRMDVDKLQAQIAPTCWVPGTAHIGLTGAGTFAVTDVVGAYVTMSVPSVWGRTNETPARTIPKAGELQFAVDGVVADDHQLHYDAEQILGAPAAANSIVYNFRLGVTGSITPLQRCK